MVFAVTMVMFVTGGQQFSLRGWASLLKPKRVVVDVAHDGEVCGDLVANLTVQVKDLKLSYARLRVLRQWEFLCGDSVRQARPQPSEGTDAVNFRVFLVSSIFVSIQTEGVDLETHLERERWKRCGHCGSHERKENGGDGMEKSWVGVIGFLFAQ